MQKETKRRISTEFRVSHKTVEEKTEYELKLDQKLKEAGYKNRNEFIKECIRHLCNG
jgi:hypothetical protein